MPPKASSSKDKDLTAGEEDVIQAVILAESFNKRFKPLTTDRPRCLLPICNATLLDWTLESLALAGVQEIFVVCRSHPELVKNAIKESKWSKSGSGLKIVPIVTAKETFSPGDALRDIYTHGIITTDFVLVTGDLVSNIRIDEVVRVHKERRKKDRDAIMTMVVKQSGVEHRTRSKGESGVFVLDPLTDQLLHYEPVTGFPPTKFAQIPREVLQDHPEVEIRYDLIDCSIDVCSVDVPSLFQDNFDYGHIRRDFVHGVLTSDLLMKNIYCYVAKDGYAARVQDTKSYDAISKDIMSRWTFPLVPDDNHPGGHHYEHRRGNKYLPKDGSVVLSRTCTIGNNTLIGAHSQIYDNVEITTSVIGQHCTINAGCTIRNSYIFDHTVIGPNCVIDQSIIGAGVVIREGTIVKKGCLVADGVIVGPKAVLQEFERVSKKREIPEGEEEEDSELEDFDPAELDKLAVDLGSQTNAFVWPRRVSDPEDVEVDELESFNNQRLVRLGDDASKLGSSDPDSVTSSSIDGSSTSAGSSMTGDESPTTPTTPLTPASSLPDAEAEFQFEVTQSLERAFEEGHSLENASVELKTLRMASNVPLRKVREAVVAAIVDNIKLVDGAAAQKTEIERMMGRWGALINKIGGIDGVETVQILQNHCACSERQLPFGQLLVTFYQDDIVDDDDIRGWLKLGTSKGEDEKQAAVSENYKKFWMLGARLLQQISEQESSDEDEDSDDEEESETNSNQAGKKVVEESESEDEESDEEEATTAKAPAPDSSDEEQSASEDFVAPVAQSDVVPSQVPASTPTAHPPQNSSEAEENEATPAAQPVVTPEAVTEQASDHSTTTRAVPIPAPEASEPKAAAPVSQLSPVEISPAPPQHAAETVSNIGEPAASVASSTGSTTTLTAADDESESEGNPGHATLTTPSILPPASTTTEGP